MKRSTTPLIRWDGRVHQRSLVPVTVIVITKNEQANIARCLSSLMWAQQLIVIDSGSEDDTVTLARSMGAEVVETSWRGYAGQREFALRHPKVRHEWVLFVDADEWASTELVEAVANAVARQDAVAFWAYKRLIFQGRWIKHCGWYPSARIVVLMRRDRAQFDAREGFSEHARIDGPVLALGADIVDDDQKGLRSWLHKHVDYAKLEAERRANPVPAGEPAVHQSRIRTFLKDVLAPKVPARPLVQFLYMYVLRLGFLDGRAGLSFCIYHAWFQRVVSDLGEVKDCAPDERVKVVFMLGNYPPAFKGGGPVRSIHAIVNRNHPRVDSYVLCSDRDWGASERLPVPANKWTESHGARVYYSSDDRVSRYIRGLWAVRRVGPSILYLNGVFDVKHALVPLVAHRLGMFRQSGVVICPRGELDPGAMGTSSKKRLALQAMRRLGFYRSVTVHATNPMEGEAAARVLGVQRTFVRAPETGLPETAADNPPAEPGRIAYYSRIDRKKGLHVLLSALAHVSKPVVLDVIGSAQDSAYQSECEALARTLPQHRISFLGAIPPEETRRVLSKYGAIFMPTAGENFGHVVAECLSVSRPIYLPPTTPWSDLVSRLGCLVDGLDPHAWARAIDEFTEMSSVERSRLYGAVAAEYNAWRDAVESPSTLEAMMNCVFEGERQ